MIHEPFVFVPSNKITGFYSSLPVAEQLKANNKDIGILG